MTWAETALGELVELRRGFDLPAPERRRGDVPVVSSRGVTGRHDRSRVTGPGVVTGRTGTLGGVFFVERDFWPLNTTLYVHDFKGNDPRFVACLLETLDYEAHNDKAAIPGVSRQHLHEIPVRRPPLREQRRIAGAIRPLDRRLRLLRRMNDVLGATAATLHAALPAGAARPLADLCARIGNGATPARKEPAFWRRGTIPWFKSGELKDEPLVGAEEHITPRGLEESACRVWPAGAVLIAMYASPTVGRLGVLTVPGATNQALCALVAKEELGPWFLFHALRATRGRLQRLATGAVQQNINQRMVREHSVPVPAERAARAFHDRVARLHALQAAHLREARKLAELREVSVRELVKGRLAPPS